MGTRTVANPAYQIATWVRSSGKTADTFDITTHTSIAILVVTRARPCALTTYKTAPQTLGTTVTFTATATDGTAPYQFKWWLNTDGGPVWTALQDWSTSNTLMWTPTVANPAYQIATWVRSSGKTTDTFESTKLTSFAIIAPPPASLSSVTPDKTAPQTHASPTSRSADPTDGTAPYQFKWWLNTD